MPVIHCYVHAIFCTSVRPLGAKLAVYLVLIPPLNDRRERELIQGLEVPFLVLGNLLTHASAALTNLASLGGGTSLRY